MVHRAIGGASTTLLFSTNRAKVAYGNIMYNIVGMGRVELPGYCFTDSAATVASHPSTRQRFLPGPWFFRLRLLPLVSGSPILFSTSSEQ